MANRNCGSVYEFVKDILLATINAKWIHPSLALRLLKANLGALEETCEIIELNLRQPFSEKIETLLAAHARIIGISVSIWNHSATIELLAEMEKAWAASSAPRPIVVLGGPEVSYLPPDAEIFRHADYVICGEGELAFAALCESILAAKTTPPLRPPQEPSPLSAPRRSPQFIQAAAVKLDEIKSAYHLYTDEDLAKKLVYVEASRGCPFNCEFCLSAVKGEEEQGAVREFPLEPFLAQMDELLRRAALAHNSKPITFKFLDRTFNVNIKRAVQICEFFLEKIAQGMALVVHFEMVASLFAPDLVQTLSRFPPGTLRLEIGIQTLNAEVSARIGRPSSPAKELEALRLLREKTSAIIHADLIAGLPGENLQSFGEGFDRLWLALNSALKSAALNSAFKSAAKCSAEIQLGILKLLPGAPISRHNEAFAMNFNPAPPYEVLETSSIKRADLERIKNFARFWELIVNRELAKHLPESLKNAENEPIFDKFMQLSDFLFAKFGKNWGIDRGKLLYTIEKFKLF